MSPLCLTCRQVFPDYKELARHISRSKNGHRKGKRWAARYLLNQRALDKKVSKKKRPHIALTEQEKENKKSLKRELAGKTVNVKVKCPRCKVEGMYEFPMEYAESEESWKVGDTMMKLCLKCLG